MSLVHDVVKMKLVRSGYLPNYPYHMISDREMCDAFLQVADSDNYHVTGFFADTYPCPDPSLSSEYTRLVNSIIYSIQQLKESNDASYALPDWVYSYMLGEVIHPNSDSLDIHDMLTLMDMDNLYDELTPEIARRCLLISTAWVNKLSRNERYDISADGTILGELRPPTMFGEPHVLKALRLAQVDILK